MQSVLYEGSRWEVKKETTRNAPSDNPKNDDGTPQSEIKEMKEIN